MLQNANSIVHLKTGKKTQSNEIKKVYFRFDYVCVFSYDRYFHPQLINVDCALKPSLQKSQVTWLVFNGFCTMKQILSIIFTE